MKTECFDLRVLLSITTERLLINTIGPNDNGIKDIYEILTWMTGETVWTHQLPRFGGECKPWLLKWFPELSIVGEVKEMKRLDKLCENDNGEEGVELWLSTLPKKYNLKAEYDVPKIPEDSHQSKNPFSEIIEMLNKE